MPEEESHTNLLTTIRELKAKGPYSPFEIVTASGDRHRIEAPANLVEMRTELFYAYRSGDGFVFIRINQIVSVDVPKVGPRHRRKAS
jgi:hypothetical protein